MRRQWIQPLHGWSSRGRTRLAAVEENFAILIAAYEVARADHIGDTTPAMSMEGDDLAGRDVRVNDSNAIVFEQAFMMRGCGLERVQRIWPRPA